VKSIDRIDRAVASAVGLVICILFGAVVIGGIGFWAGVSLPQGELGPLLGIFITGPLGVLAGAVGGYFYWRVMSKRTVEKDTDKTKTG